MVAAFIDDTSAPVSAAALVARHLRTMTVDELRCCVVTLGYSSNCAPLTKIIGDQRDDKLARRLTDAAGAVSGVQSLT